MTTYAPRHVDIWPWTGWYSAVNWSRQNQSNTLSMGRGVSSGTQNNEVVWHVALDSGTWTLTVIGEMNTMYGISTVSLDATTLGTLDWYAGSVSYNNVKQITGISVGSAGVYALKFKAATKNASSSAYYLAFNMVTLTRTGP